MLTEKGYQVRKAINGQMALNTVRSLIPDLILLDINMPDLNGYQVCEQLKADEKTREIRRDYAKVGQVAASSDAK